MFVAGWLHALHGLSAMFALHQVEKCVAKASHGAYVVRASENVAGAFTLVVKGYMIVHTR